jgi:hypothetical protein
MAGATAPARARRAPAPARQPVAGRAPLRVVGPRRRQPQRARRSPLVLALSTVLASLLAVGGAHAYLTAGQVRLARLQQQLDSAQTTERGLEVQVAQLENPSRVVGQAQQQGLTVPTQVTDLPLVGGPTPSDSTPKR